MSTLEDLLSNQKQITGGIETLYTNFKKDGPDRKTSDYIRRRLETLDAYWKEYEMNQSKLIEYPDKSNEYFVGNHYQQAKQYYLSVRDKILATPTSSIIRPATPTIRPATPTLQPTTPSASATKQPEFSEVFTKSQGISSKTDELFKKQMSNFKAFARTVSTINVDIITEKWEFEDILKNLESRWTTIDKVHWELDSESDGSNYQYEQTFSEHEKTYANMKKTLNSKLWSMSHREKTTPKMEVPNFHGNYNQWICFKDLFTEAIHNNSFLSNAQKMQFLKAKVKGEAERLIQHLTISSDNYSICWDILQHRYNNKKMIFSSHINILMNLPVMQTASVNHLKRIHDTTHETLNAIKNLGADITSWDPLIVHILCQKLDSDTHSEYMKSVKEPRELPLLSEFLSFLENEFTSMESSKRKQENSNQKQQVSKSSNKYDNRKSFDYKQSYQSNKDVSQSISSKKFLSNNTCPVCGNQHGIFYCKKFLEMSTANKKQCMHKYNLCQNCLYDHYGNECFSTKRCRECDGCHNTILHDMYKQTSSQQENSTRSNQRNSNSHVAQQDETPEILLSTAMIKVQKFDGTYQTMRALIDQGSQTSLITENAAQQLALPRQRCKGVISGIGAKDNTCKGVININCTPTSNNYHINTDAYIMKNLTKHLPSSTFSKPSWDYLENIQLADPDFNISRPIDILLGADIYSSIILEGICRSEQTALIAQQTRLGWILCGSTKTLQCNVIQVDINEMQKFWEIEDIGEETSYSSDDLECIRFYQDTTERLADGKYQVRLPLSKNVAAELGRSKQKAIAQFVQLEKKLAKNQHISNEYKSFINEYQQLGHMQLSESSVSKPTLECYLPHHCVLREDSTTTALRVVFNASAKTSSGKSLNDLMQKGPNLQQDLQSLILKWRQYKVAYTADVEKMFRQIWVHPADRKLQKIIWRDNPQQSLQDYECTTVTYGMKAAPFLSMMTLKQLAKDERQNYQEASKVIEESCYMDDLVHGSHDIGSAKKLQHELITLMKQGGFNLRKWSSNDARLLREEEQQAKIKQFKQAEASKTLGLQWNPVKDQFSFASKIESSNEKTTKRSILSDISKIFDPLGWIAPITTSLKILFQNVWASNIQWDDEVPKEIFNQWIKIKDELKYINQFEVPRWLGITISGSIELHGFCDSSMKAYAAVVYCKIVAKDKKEVKVTLVAAKTRLVPSTKNVSLPRLELCGALLLSKLMSKIKECLAGHDIKSYGWCDSTAVLGWLQGDPGRWKTFVANRTRQITNTMPASGWRYVKSQDNPADSASRGLSVSQLRDHSLWWQGPTWLPTYNSDEEKNQAKYVTVAEIKSEKQVNNVIKQEKSIISELLIKHSSISKISRILAWVYRFIASKKQKGFLTLEEIKTAKQKIIKHEQQEQFSQEISNLKQSSKLQAKSKIINLNPFLDKDGILRVGGRLKHAHISNVMQHPIIIQHSGRLTELIIDEAHKTMLHGGARLTLSFIRQRYWIVGGNRATKARIRRCVTCAKQNPARKAQIMGDLPEARSNPSRPFTHTGVDFTGHIFVKSSKGRGIKSTKGYVAVFVCMATKAVHLELVSDLSTSAFIAALRRMAARKGTPSHIYSDNGSNFIGANRVLQQEYQEIQQALKSNEVQAEVRNMEIKWHFNAPLWPTAGGLWEAAVKSFKHHFKRIIGDQILTYEELNTVLAQIEGCLNSRPLCPITEDPEELNFLTPAHFLTGGSNVTLYETETDLRTRWQLTQKIVQDLWQRWRSEYLTQLSARSKWLVVDQNIKLDEVVIIHDANLPPGKWLMGRVVELHPGSDSHVRVVTLKTKNGFLKRPVTKISILPVQEHEQNEQKINQKSTPSISKPRIKLSTLFAALIMFLSIISTSQCTLNVTKFRDNQHLYFDKLSNMNIIRDEWKLIVYYKMQPYWEGITALNKSTITLDRLCKRMEVNVYCNMILLQLRHELNELDYSNKLLLSQQDGTRPARKRRGLIDGVGYLAHSLFGVLDSRFAEQYQTDIRLLREKQQHISILSSNQTSIIEAEFNALKRIENTTSQQYKILHQQFIESAKTEGLIKTEIQLSNEFNMGAIIASNVLQNLKHLQGMLLDTITDTYHGRLNPYLITSKQMQDQLSIISSHVSNDVTLPINNIHVDLSKMFKLITSKARMVTDYLIFELRIPLISRDVFEIFKIIPIPQQKQDRMISIKPLSNYVAINLKKDTYITLSENGIRSCLVADGGVYLCHVSKPIYRIGGDKDFCLKKEEVCETIIEPCKNIWLQSNSLNHYIYFCCSECQLRTMCPENEVTIHHLTRSGILYIDNGCIIKTDTFEIIAHGGKTSQVYIKSNIMKYPVIAPINHIINISIPKEKENENVEQESKYMREIEEGIRSVKESSATSMTSHDIHHYAAIYVVIGVVVLAGAACWWRRRGRGAWSLQATAASAQTTAPAPAERPLPLLPQQPVYQSVSARVNRSTSPIRVPRCDFTSAT